MSWQRFGKEDLVSFIKALDRNLEDRTIVLLIGGAAAAIAYDSGTKTQDLDIYNTILGSDSDIEQAALKASQETALWISVGGAGVADLPYNFEDRTRPITGLNLRKLEIIVPDKYDLALSKTMRGYPHDIQAVVGIDRAHHLSMDTLLDRFETELVKQAVGQERNLRINMMLVIDQLYGRDEAEEFADRWSLPKPT